MYKRIRTYFVLIVGLFTSCTHSASFDIALNANSLFGRKTRKESIELLDKACTWDRNARDIADKRLEGIKEIAVSVNSRKSTRNNIFLPDGRPLGTDIVDNFVVDGNGLYVVGPVMLDTLSDDDGNCPSWYTLVFQLLDPRDEEIKTQEALNNLVLEGKDITAVSVNPFVNQWTTHEGRTRVIKPTDEEGRVYPCFYYSSKSSIEPSSSRKWSTELYSEIESLPIYVSGETNPRRRMGDRFYE